MIQRVMSVFGFVHCGGSGIDCIDRLLFCLSSIVCISWRLAIINRTINCLCACSVSVRHPTYISVIAVPLITILPDGHIHIQFCFGDSFIYMVRCIVREHVEHSPQILILSNIPRHLKHARWRWKSVETKLLAVSVLTL